MSVANPAEEGIRDASAVRALIDRLGALRREAVVTRVDDRVAHRARFDGVRYRRAALRVFDDEARESLRPPASCRVDFELDSAWTFYSFASFNCAWNGSGALVILELPDRIVPNETRASTRLEVSDMPLRVEIGDSANRFSAHVLDVNRSGLGVDLPTDAAVIGVGDTVAVAIRYHEQTLRTNAVVRWSAGSRVGLQLIDLEAASERAWHRLVHGLQVESLMRRLGKAD